MLWFIILGCFIKVFVQVELGRFAISRGLTTLEAMNSIPGPRFIVSCYLPAGWVRVRLAMQSPARGQIEFYAERHGDFGTDSLLAARTMDCGTGI